MKDASFRVFLFVLGLLGLSWPLVEVFRHSVVSYIFALWSVLILLGVVLQRVWSAGEKRPPSV